MFWFHLARTVTHRSVRETQEIIDALEFAEWRALYRIKPWGDDWAQADLIAWASLGGPQTIKTGTFLPPGFPVGMRPVSDLPSPAEVEAKMYGWLAASGVPTADGNVNR